MSSPKISLALLKAYAPWDILGFPDTFAGAHAVHS